MLITQLKAKEAITSLTAGKKVFIINCHGCKEVRFPEKEAARLQKELAAEGNVTGIMTTDSSVIRKIWNYVLRNI